MRVFITGAAGYIGSMVTDFLLKKGHDVFAYDSLVFGGEHLQDFFVSEHFSFERGDIRDIKKITRIFYEWKPQVVVHLAAIVGAPECDENVALTELVNYDATCKIIDLSIEKGIKQFIFSSTCSNYGIADTSKLANEEDNVSPISSYADTKIRVEKYLKSKTGQNNFAPVILRLATVYGISRRMRFDLLLNEFVRDALINGKLEVFMGNAWRPIVHVIDVVRVIATILEKDPKSLGGEIINVGNNDFNIQKMDLAKAIGEKLENIKIIIASETQDPRNYRVAFSKMEKLLGVKAMRTPEQGIQEILKAAQSNIFKDMYNPIYKNKGHDINIIGSIFN
ncbi:MAG: nucleoside-diphosphate-sugar epimerase [Candidatus Peregrinibacteria bacterium GW2011_GWE2_39_6]|nr:MAG: nucleoside-diphosphate-sugar epimerase [Candidatus Peregrinibacteria bacterium GW2011_GWF2_39_17]KKR26474.1 MAG: nucleoside-diphosphate-sugar epimerase [Candidatus Peregrinibacteria bacterium GW2011_GWE2_39_6]HCW32573.1 hypothetical protein [Candidatus Peregrinibacteria bacterium]